MYYRDINSNSDTYGLSDHELELKSKNKLILIAFAVGIVVGIIPSLCMLY